MENQNKPLVYIAGDIMTHGSNLARQEEYDKFVAEKLNVDVYSPVMNKSINDKSNMTEEENNHLAEKIVAADVDRLWNSDAVVLCPEQSAIGTMCEMGILFGWKYIIERMNEIIRTIAYENVDEEGTPVVDEAMMARIGHALWNMCDLVYNKEIYAHYSDIRTNHLNEKDWRRSFSINQFLYGIILAATTDNTLHDNFDEILPKLHELYDDIGNANE